MNPQFAPFMNLLPLLAKRIADMPETDPKKGPLLDALLALLTNPAFIALIIKLLGGLAGP